MKAVAFRGSASNVFRKDRFIKNLNTIWYDRSLYLLAIPGIVYFLVFHYAPMYGVLFAFKKYDIFKGFSGSEWVGLKNFQDIFAMYGFQNALKNTFIISFEKLIFGFPVPIILALLINEVKNRTYKKIVQTAVFLPHFISWVIISGLLYAILSPNTGMIKQICDFAGYKGEIINILVSKEHFRSLVITTHVWKGAGIGAIMYLAAIAGIDQQLFEAATIDGAGRLKQLWHITLPCIRTTIVILLILRMGDLLNAGFDQIFVMANENYIVRDTVDIIDTFIYRVGITETRYHYATAIGLFKSSVSIVFILATNYIAKKIDKDSGLL